MYSFRVSLSPGVQEDLFDDIRYRYFRSLSKAKRSGKWTTAVWRCAAVSGCDIRNRTEPILWELRGVGGIEQKTSDVQRIELEEVV